jgi:hypothetical protein
METQKKKKTEFNKLQVSMLSFRKKECERKLNVQQNRFHLFMLKFNSVMHIWKWKCDAIFVIQKMNKNAEKGFDAARD